MAVRVGEELNTGASADDHTAAPERVSCLERDGGQVLLVGANSYLPPGQRVYRDHLELKILIPRRIDVARRGVVYEWIDVSLHIADIRGVVVAEFENGRSTRRRIRNPK